VSIPIVDVFEVIQIHEHQRQAPTMLFSLRKTVFQPIMEQAIRVPAIASGLLLRGTYRRWSTPWTFRRKHRVPRCGRS
jgi:hypothetical protein